MTGSASNRPDFEGAAALREAVREFTDRSERIIRQHGLTLEHYQLLLLLRVLPKERATIGHLHQALHRGQSAVTQLARRMQNKGLISRELSENDARVRYLTLTKKGERRLSDAVTALEAERTRLLALLRGISPDKREP
jgi:DNA-binding MarR family transcriptional regulator